MPIYSKRKHVIKEVTKDTLKLPTADQSIVRVIASPGNNLHKVVDANGENFLISMPSKFRRNIWIGRRNFVLVQPIEEGVKVKAEIVTILTTDHILYYHEEGIWPEVFADAVPKRNSDDLYKDGYDPLKYDNPNRVKLEYTDSESEESDDSDSQEVEEDEENQNTEEKEAFCEKEKTLEKTSIYSNATEKLSVR